MSENLKIGVVGEGSWATAIIKLLQYNTSNIIWAVRDADMLQQMKENHHNPLYLSDVELEIDKITFETSVKETVRKSDIILVVLPAAFIESSLEGMTESDFQGKFVFSATKGIIPSQHKTVCNFFHDSFAIPFSHLGFISGPSHAEEIALERLTFLTVLSENSEIATVVANALHCRFLKVITSSDVLGAEYSSALKNVMAIATGVCHGLGYGDNSISVLVSCAIREIQDFLNVMAPAERNLLNYVYLGDLMVTCYSQFSRNRTFGAMIGKGYTVKSAQLEMNMVAEGYYSVKSIMEICREKEIEMPILQAIYHILYERISPSVEMKLLTDKLK
jgi:glycerol-3-phosphate dehydrogenase (NAD(P)+)